MCLFQTLKKFYSKIMFIYLNFTSDARKDKNVDLKKKKKNLVIYESFFCFLCENGLRRSVSAVIYGPVLH